MRESTALLTPTDAPDDDQVDSGALVDVPVPKGKERTDRVARRPTAPAGQKAAERRPKPRPESFESFFEDEYTNLLRAMYLVAGKRHEAEELAQEAFVRAYERWELVRGADNPQGYLYRIGLNLYRSKLRRAARAARKAIRPPVEPDPFGAADDRDAIGRALATLSRGQREAVVMVEWLGMTDDEAGAALGISPITVRVRIHRARGTLRAILRGPEEENE
jgi:RNA polymerase sigma factor (sigma-70 family)